MAYSWWNPEVWLLFATMVAITVASVEGYRRRHPLQPPRGREVPHVGPEGSGRALWQVLWTTGAEAVNWERTAKGGERLLTAEEVIRRVDPWDSEGRVEVEEELG